MLVILFAHCSTFKVPTWRTIARSNRVLLVIRLVRLGFVFAALFPFVDSVWWHSSLCPLSFLSHHGVKGGGVRAGKCSKGHETIHLESPAPLPITATTFLSLNV